jgi:hypothetical protein
MLARYGILVGTVLIATVAPSGRASAGTPLSCGDTITRSVVLTGDLNCVGDGLLIDADGVTINLNGHQIAGSGSGKGISIGPDLQLPNSHVDLSVRNGSLRNFAVGADLEVGGSVHLENLDIARNGKGVGSVLPGLTVFVKDCMFQHNGAAVGGLPGPVNGGSMSVIVNDSTFVFNDLALDINAVSRGTTVESSVFRDNGTAIRAVNGGLNVADSQFVTNPQGIIALQEGVVLTRSVIRDSSVGLDIFDDFYQLTVQGNRFFNSGIGVRIAGTNLPDSHFAGNTLAGNSAAGLFVDLRAGSVQVSDNSFNRNGYAPGAYTDPSGRPLTAGAWANAGTFSGNVATRNAGYGIEGYGVVDGGGNIARHNGNPAQCLGIACSTHDTLAGGA